MPAIVAMKKTSKPRIRKIFLTEAYEYLAHIIPFDSGSVTEYF
jgi:hypothetical protein